MAVSREVGGQTNVAAMLALVGTLQYERGNLRVSEALLHQSLALSGRLANAFNLGMSGRDSGAWRGGAAGEQAAATCQRSLRILAQIALLAGTPDALEGLTGAWWDQGEGERALGA